MMTIDGEAALGATIEVPRTGAWTIDATLASDIELGGQVTVDVEQGSLTLLGTVVRSGTWQDVSHVRVVGGSGGLSSTARVSHYSTATVAVILGDLLRQVGEKLSATADSATLQRRVTSWTTTAIPTGTLISKLLEVAAPDATWRVLPDGTVWVGPETWPDSGLIEDADFVVLARDPMKMTAVLGVEVPRLWVGVSFEGQKVANVRHEMGSPATRTVVSFQGSEPAGSDRFRTAMAALVRSLNPTEYSSLCWATIVQQSGDTIDVQPVDAGKPSMAGVKLFAGVAQWKMKLVPGGHVLVGWGNRDPSQAFVIGFGADVVTQSLSIVSPDITLDSEGAKIGSAIAPYEAMPKWETYRQAQALLNSAAGGWIQVFASMALVCTGPLSPLGPGFAFLASSLALFEASAAAAVSSTSKNS